MTAEFQTIDLQIPQELAGQRLDSALARLMPEHSRTPNQELDRGGRREGESGGL